MKQLEFLTRRGFEFEVGPSENEINEAKKRMWEYNKQTLTIPNPNLLNKMEKTKSVG